MTNQELLKRIGCESCNFTGVYVASTRPDQNGEPQEVEVTCECVDSE